MSCWKLVRRLIFILWGAHVALGTSTQAQAQQEQETATANPSQSSFASSSPPSSDIVRLDEVTVTSQRRDESQEKVPMSLRAFSPQELEDRDTKRTSDVFQATPNVSFSSPQGSLQGTNLFIRGVGSVIASIDQSIGVYVDDVFVGHPQAFDIDFLDPERVEVLRGPQGTLYGRNALGGAVSLFSALPENMFSSSFDVEYGNYDYRRVRTTANLPLIKDTLLSRFTFNYTERDGTVKNLFDGKHINDLDNLSGRTRLLFLPTENLEAHVLGEYAQENKINTAYGPLSSDNPYHVNIFDPLNDDREIYGASGKIVYKAPQFTLHAITGFRGVNVQGDGSDFRPENEVFQGYVINQRQFSQEVRLASPATERLRWVGGLFYYHENLHYINSYSLVPGLASFGLPPGYRETSDADVATNSYAAFGDMTYTVFPKFDVTLGVRFSYDEKELAYRHENTLGFPQVFALAQQAKRDAVFNNWTPRFVAAYQWTPAIMTYASISRGYKAGGFNIAFAGSPKFKFSDEQAWNYELGLKTLLLDERLSLNMTAFYFDWRDQQISVFNGFFTTTDNAKRSRSVGGEVELAARPLPGLDFTAGFGYADSTFRNFKNFQPGEDASGNRVPLTSKFTVNASAQYRYLLNSWAALMVRWDYLYRSSLFWDVANNIKEPPYSLVNLRLGVEAERWDLFFFMRNALDEHYSVGAFNFTPFGPYTTPGDPRTYGVQARVRF